MYAIIKTGGQQYRVAVGDVIEVEKIPQDPGSEIRFEDVLMVSDEKGFEVGRPALEKARVMGEIVEQYRDEKILTLKHKRRKNYRRTIGHRQQLTRIRIKDIVSA